MAFKMKGYSAFTKSPMKQDIDPMAAVALGTGSKVTGVRKLMGSIKDYKKNKDLTFDQAFAAARKAGKKTFTWKGKPYHTKTKEEVEEKEKVTQPNPMGAAAIGAGSKVTASPAEPAEPAKLERP